MSAVKCKVCESLPGVYCLTEPELFNLLRKAAEAGIDYRWNAEGSDDTSAITAATFEVFDDFRAERKAEQPK